MKSSRWEQGSEFHWPDLGTPQVDPARDALAARPLRRFASGRAALSAVVRHSEASRLWIPSYFCPQVVDALERVTPIEVYPDLPTPGAAPVYPPAEPGDAVLLVDTFAIRRPPADDAPPGIIVIEDHTHDPLSRWATTSTAHYCVASLRKTVPIPDGGIAWSPRGARLPPEPALAESPNTQKLVAMLLKRLYLDGHPVEKAEFRTLAIEGEAALGDQMAMSRLSAELWVHLPLSRWRQARGENFVTFRDALGSRQGLAVLGALGSDDPPFSILLSFDDSERRSEVRAALIAGQIYPAILWDLSTHRGRPGVRPSDLQRAETLISVHCDARYGAADMERVAACIHRATSPKGM